MTGRMMLGMLALCLAVSPAQAIVDERGSVAGSAMWTGSTEPGVPERLVRFSIAATNEHETLPECPSVSVCPPLGHAVLIEGPAAVLQITILCLSVVDEQAFFAGYAPENEHVIPVAGFIESDLETAGATARVALRTGSGFDCRDEHMKEDLRRVATPVREGAILVVDKCNQIVVCPADGATSL